MSVAERNCVNDVGKLADNYLYLSQLCRLVRHIQDPEYESFHYFQIMFKPHHKN